MTTITAALQEFVRSKEAAELRYEISLWGPPWLFLRSCAELRREKIERLKDFIHYRGLEETALQFTEIGRRALLSALSQGKHINYDGGYRSREQCFTGNGILNSILSEDELGLGALAIACGFLHSNSRKGYNLETCEINHIRSQSGAPGSHMLMMSFSS